MPRFNIRHVTKYTYNAPVRDSANQIVLFPIRDEFQELAKQDLQISGEPDLDIYRDYYGNEIGSFMNAEPHMELVIDSRVQVVTRARPMPEDMMSAEAQWGQLEAIKQGAPFLDFLHTEHFDAFAEVNSISNPTLQRKATPLQAARGLNQYVFDNFRYIKGLTSVETTLDEAWKLKAGVCQDFAHILLVMLRLLGVPARYVSGYICPHDSGMRGEGATHAWVEAYIPSYGWLGLDPTNNCFVNDLHVRLAVGRNFADCSPVRGTYKGEAEHALEVAVTVSYEDGKTVDVQATVITSLPAKNGSAQNSYQRYMEMIQQQQ